MSVHRRRKTVRTPKDKDVVLIGNGKIIYAPWMFSMLFEDEEGTQFAIAKSAVRLSLPATGPDMYLGMAAGLTLYPALHESSYRLLKLQQKKDNETSRENIETIRTYTVGLIEEGNDTWDHKTVYFFPIVPRKEKIWNVVPHPLLFSGLIACMQSELKEVENVPGFKAHPIFLSSHIDPKTCGQEEYKQLRAELNCLNDPMFDSLVDLSMSTRRSYKFPFSSGELDGTNNFQAGIGITFTEDVENGHETAESIVKAATALKRLAGKTLSVSVKRKFTLRTLTFTTEPEFSYTSSYDTMPNDILCVSISR